jgi:hypothetical protein
MTSNLDPHGQPFNLHFNRARRAERDLSEMLGLAKGLLADGVVSETEAQLLRDWASGHSDAVEQWPVSVLKERLDRIFSDGCVSEVERKDLSALLSAIVGGTAGVVCGEDAATELPVDRPPPELVWRDSVFVYRAASHSGREPIANARRFAAAASARKTSRSGRGISSSERSAAATGFTRPLAARLRRP